MVVYLQNEVFLGLEACRGRGIRWSRTGGRGPLECLEFSFVGGREVSCFFGGGVSYITGVHRKFVVERM